MTANEWLCSVASLIVWTGLLFSAYAQPHPRASLTARSVETPGLLIVFVAFNLVFTRTVAVSLLGGNKWWWHFVALFVSGAGCALLWGRRLWFSERGRFRFHLQFNRLPLAGLLALMLGSDILLFQLLHDHDSSFGERLVEILKGESTAIAIVTALATAVGGALFFPFPAFLEELLYRQWLLFGLTRHFSNTFSVTATTALFTLAHSPTTLGRTLELIVFGVLLSVLFVRTRSLFLCTLIHAASNLLVVPLAILSATHLPFGSPTAIVLGAVCTLLGAVIVLRRPWESVSPTGDTWLLLRDAAPPPAQALSPSTHPIAPALQAPPQTAKVHNDEQTAKAIAATTEISRTARRDRETRRAKASRRSPMRVPAARSAARPAIRKRKPPR